MEKKTIPKFSGRSTEENSLPPGIKVFWSQKVGFGIPLCGILHVPLKCSSLPAKDMNTPSGSVKRQAASLKFCRLGMEGGG